MATADLISRARAGGGDAFQALAEPHRRELLVHCYRMLGSFQDAEGHCCIEPEGMGGAEQSGGSPS